MELLKTEMVNLKDEIVALRTKGQDDDETVKAIHDQNQALQREMFKTEEQNKNIQRKVMDDAALAQRVDGKSTSALQKELEDTKMNSQIHKAEMEERMVEVLSILEGVEDGCEAKLTVLRSEYRTEKTTGRK